MIKLVLSIVGESILALLKMPLTIFYVMSFGRGIGAHNVGIAYQEYRAAYGLPLRDCPTLRMIHRLQRAVATHERQIISADKSIANINKWRSMGVIGYWWLGARTLLVFFVYFSFSAALREYAAPLLESKFPVQMQWADWASARPQHWIVAQLSGDRAADRSFPLTERPDMAYWDQDRHRLISYYNKQVIPYRAGLHVYWADGSTEMSPEQIPPEAKRSATASLR